MRTNRIQIQELPWLLTRGRMTWATGAAILMLILYIFQWAMAYCDPGGPEKLFGLDRSGILYGCIWEFVSYPFLHHLSHPFGICFTILGLIIVGSELEGIIGKAHFTILLICSATVAGLAYLAISSTGRLLGAGPAICAMIVGCTTILAEFPVILPFGIRFRYKHAGWALIVGLLGYGLLSGRSGAYSTDLVNLSGATVGWIYVRVLGFGSPLPGEMALRQRLAERARARRLPVRLYLATYVDPILEKIYRDGICSLSRAEKQVLRQARQKVLLNVS
jgi:membrane associated rhomboid family serine protease